MNELLTKANEIRFAQADVKRELRTMRRVEARIRAASLLLDPPPHIQRMRVGVFLRALPHVGSHRAHRYMRQAYISHDGLAIGPEHRRCTKALDGWQRRRLAALLEDS